MRTSILSLALLATLACGSSAAERVGLEGNPEVSGPSDGGAPDDDASDACPTAPTTFADTLTVKATSKGSASAGPYTRGGATYTTSPAALKSAQAHSTHYDGATDFNATYTIVLDASGNLDKTMSRVTFKATTFTDQGTLQKTKFTTNAIDITSVTLTDDCPPQLKAFSFKSSDWYPDDATGAGGLKDRTLSGSIDLSAGTASYDAKYASKANGAIYTYKVTGKISTPCPTAEDCEDAGDPDTDGDDDDAPPDPDPELAAAGTPCDDSSECDVGLACTDGVCQ